MKLDVFEKLPDKEKLKYRLRFTKNRIVAVKIPDKNRSLSLKERANRERFANAAKSAKGSKGLIERLPAAASKVAETKKRKRREQRRKRVQNNLSVSIQ